MATNVVVFDDAIVRKRGVCVEGVSSGVVGRFAIGVIMGWTFEDGIVCVAIKVRGCGFERRCGDEPSPVERRCEVRSVWLFGWLPPSPRVRHQCE